MSKKWRILNQSERIKSSDEFRAGIVNHYDNVWMKAEEPEESLEGLQVLDLPDLVFRRKDDNYTESLCSTCMSRNNQPKCHKNVLFYKDLESGHDDYVAQTVLYCDNYDKISRKSVKSKKPLEPLNAVIQVCPSCGKVDVDESHECSPSQWR